MTPPFKKKTAGVQLPTHPWKNEGLVTYGYLTPEQDLMPQQFSIPPQRVIPIVFIPGIMGSNLRLKPDRQKIMGRKDNLAWRPDFKTFCVSMMNTGPEERQLLLDPDATEVDTYDPVENPTGSADETSDPRNAKVSGNVFYHRPISTTSPLLVGDPPTQPNRRTPAQKARARGWGEVFYSSYGDVLQLCEEKLNGAFMHGVLNAWWREIVDVDPKEWQASSKPALTPLTVETLRAAVSDCWFPVHAMGYNWLESNESSGTKLAGRVERLIRQYKAEAYQCEKVILVTHSMGGLVARALVHPSMGKLHDKVLGIVHGVMPAMGAAATYKRMRCGFEGLAAGVLGKDGKCVTAVLANAQGGLELLPSTAYGNAWLVIKHKGESIFSLPEKGDPYEEIYKVQGRWYGLLTREWINPGKLQKRGFERTTTLLDLAKKFHTKMAGVYHTNSYAHYGADTTRPAWQSVTWAIQSADFSDLKQAKVILDLANGTVQLADKNPRLVSNLGVPHPIARLQPPTEPGDETVPLFSADDQLRSGKFKGIFRQTGYEHQASYKDEAALRSTLYSLIQIASTMNWSRK